MSGAVKEKKNDRAEALYSVIIPVYNVAPFIEECIHSVRTQSLRDFEIILVDDGSVDGSGQICDKLATEDVRIRVVHQKNRGVSAARNVGIDLAKGEYLLFLDSDDYWNRQDVLELIEDRRRATQFQVLSFNYVKVCNGEKSKPYFPACDATASSGISLQYYMKNGLWISSAWNKAISRELFTNGQLRFVEGITAEDIDWSLRLALAADRFDYLGETVLCYRQRENSISQSITREKVETLFSNIDRCCNLLKGCKAEKEAMLKAYVGYQYGTALFNLAMLPASKEMRGLIARAKQYRYLLKWSKNERIRLLDIVTTLGGIEFVLLLLKIKSKF